MKSPRFSFREAELSKIFTKSDLKNTWKNKVRISLKKSPIPDPIEYLDFHVSLDAECLKIARLVCEGTYQPSPARRILMEKSKGLCRQIVVPSLKDSIVLQRLSDALYSDIKGKAPTNKSFFEPDDHSFSNMKKAAAGSPGYGSFRAWLNFQKVILNFTKTRNYVIVTDIANYYDTISYTHLRNVISSQIDIRETILDVLIYVLSGLLWQPDYMPRIEIGLPQINTDATRILAHCFLYELDEYLESQKHDFTRFMDDIDIGVDTIIEARHILRDIDLILQTRQVRLNSGKTKILSRNEAKEHFCVKENFFIDVSTKRIDKKIGAGVSVDLERKFIEKHLPKLYKSGKFNVGAGEKILKRALSLARKTNARIRPNLVRKIFLEKPSCRPSLLTYLTDRRLTNANFLTISMFVTSRSIVDDVTLLSSVEAIVDSQARRNAYTDKLINDISIRLYEKKTPMALYGLLWLNSKYGNYSTIVKYLRLTFDIWRSDAELGRLVGGMMPIFRLYGKQNELRKLLDNARNEDAFLVADFHDQLATDIKIVKGIKSIVAAPNSSKILGITHPKFLVLLSSLMNASLTDQEKNKILKNHSASLLDKYYRHKIALALPKNLRSTIF